MVGGATSIRDLSARAMTRHGRRRLGRAAAVLAAAVSALSCLGVGAASAQSGSYFDRNNNVGVRDRSRPDYDALGILVGSFQILPSLTVTPEYDSNIFATSNDAQADLITAIQPSIVARSNWTRHELDLSAQSTSDIYASHSQENTTDYVFSGNGRLDVLAQSNVTAGASYAHNTIPRTAEDTFTTALQPVQYSSLSANLGATQTLNRVRLSEFTSVSKIDYDNTNDEFGNPLSLADLNNTSYVWGGRADYALGPEISIFVTAQGNERNYGDTQGLNAIDRSSTGYQAAVGSSFDLTRLIRGQVQVGYLSQDYKSSLFHTVTGPAVNAKVQYFLTDLTTLTFTATRDVVDAVDPVAISYLQTKGGFQVDHELLRNVILSAQASYETDSFRGEQRDDDRISTSFSGTYLLNRYLGLTAAYSFLNESSSGLARVQDYLVNVVSLSLVLQL